MRIPIFQTELLEPQRFTICNCPKLGKHASFTILPMTKARDVKAVIDGITAFGTCAETCVFVGDAVARLIEPTIANSQNN